MPKCCTEQNTILLKLLNVKFSVVSFRKERKWVYEITMLSLYMCLSKCFPFNYLLFKPFSQSAV
jgi:hypothetical protein